MMALNESNTEEFEDETLCERLWGLTEMFPSPVRAATSGVVALTTTASWKAYKLTRATLWAGLTGFLILCLPVVFEQERFNLQQQQQQHQRRMLLGPNAAMTGS